MKKNIWILLIILFFAACGSKDSDNKSTAQKKGEILYIYNWSHYIPQNVYHQFTEETGITIIENAYDSNEEMYKNIKKGDFSYDLIVPSQDFLGMMIDENMLEKIDTNKISTYKNISSTIIDKLAKLVHTNDVYGVPYAIGATGFLINKKYITEDVSDFSIFQNEKYRGKMNLLNEMREVIVPALVTLGYHQNSTNPKELDEAKKLIESWSANIDSFNSENLDLDFNSEKYYLTHTYMDSVESLIEISPNDYKVVIPKIGGISCIDSFAIPKNAKNKGSAIKFIEFIHRPDIYSKILDYIQVPSINTEAEKLVNRKPLYTLEDVKNTTLIDHLSKEEFDIQNKYWLEIKKSKESSK